MNKSILTILLISIFLINFASANDLLGFTNQGGCMLLKQTCSSNCSYVNIIDVSINNRTILNQTAMTTNDNILWTYNFCNTSILGTYTYETAQSDSLQPVSNPINFIVNGSGQEVTQQQIILIIIGIVVIIISMIFFFILSLLFKHPGTKIFFMGLSSLTLIVLIGLIVSNGNIYLAEFPTLLGIYNNYYILITILAIGAGTAMMLWLVYYSLTQFKKTRGRIDDD